MSLRSLSLKGSSPRRSGRATFPQGFVIAPDIPAIKAMLDIYEVERKEEVFEKILFLFHEVLLGD